jgi:hypothetical protein
MPTENRAVEILQQRLSDIDHELVGLADPHAAKRVALEAERTDIVAAIDGLRDIRGVEDV